MAADHLSKGNQFMAEAEQRMNVQTKGFCCGQKARVKVEEACELYVKAANSFKMAKDWTAAGRAFEEAARLELDNKRSHESGNHYVEASKCYKKVSQSETAKCLEKAIEIYTDMGRQKVAAKHHQTIAEIYEEGETKDLTKCIYHYQQAADLFSGEESTSSTNKCYLAVAKNSALIGDQDKAVEIYERVGKAALDSNLLKYTATDLFFRAALCRLCTYATTNPEQAATMMAEMLEGYDDCYPGFAESRERTFLLKLSEAVVAGDVDAFNDAIRTHESISRMEPWYHEVIKMIRKYVKGDGDFR